ncbi:MAG: hypothetical protein KME64_31385 [Scytonematopsis contorta HA4267-MV1]|nr:hypothetical protein [Scytonematopsis contorta HA4267-MV1]
MLKRKIIYIVLFLLTIVSFYAYSYLSEKKPITNCEWSGFSDSTEKVYINAAKVVVEPWKGRHHVYGIFMIPDGYLNDRMFVVTANNAEVHCGIFVSGDSTNIENVYAKPGYYVMKGMLNTRTGLSLILQGHGDSLNQLDNWRVGYSKAKQSHQFKIQNSKFKIRS